MVRDAGDHRTRAARGGSDPAHGAAKPVPGAQHSSVPGEEEVPRPMAGGNGALVPWVRVRAHPQAGNPGGGAANRAVADQDLGLQARKQ